MHLHFKSYGEGDPIVIMHGLFGMLDNWATIGKELAEKSMVYLIDLPNHGKSPELLPFDYEHISQAANEFMQENWLFHASVIGHSLGGKAAMKLALEHPDRVEKLVVVDIGTRRYEGGHEHIFSSMLSLDPDTLQSRREAHDRLLEDIHSESVVRFLLKNLKRRRSGGYRWKFNLPVLYASYPAILSEITSDHTYEGPALFIAGGQADYLSESDMPGIRRLFPNAEFRLVENAGHWVHADQPEELVEIITEFLYA